MKCNSCWQKLDGRAVATTCGHIFCTEDASKVLSSDDSTCPVCEEILNKSKMKSVDLAPTDEWINMVMVGVPPQAIMKSAFKGVVFWIGQKDVEFQVTVRKAVQLQEKCEQMQAKYLEKMKQVEAAYTGKLQQVQRASMQKIQALEEERQNFINDKNELQEKYTEKSRQKRKLEEMYDALRNEYEQLKQSGGKEQAMIKQSNLYSFNVPMQSAFEETHKTQPTSGIHPRSSSPPNPFKPSPLYTPVAGGHPSNSFRNLLLSPPKKRSQARPRGVI
ncbi:hypothetical protein CY35_09G105400 [Sphagnum magellanicum]|nr:hypothetical protein CY35_09G105400 [Sphagnum magellanicum]KAH9553187.1 hypothetical protein CY35_09G105400 [Sphagnum magellanicum]